MAAPTIQIDGSISGAGTPGVSRDDLVLEVVTLTDPANGAGTYAWILREIPQGSAASLTGAATDTATFTIDVRGTYIVELTFNGIDRSGSDNAVGEFISSQGGAAAKLANGLRLPGATETVQFGSKGWMPALDTPWRNHDRNLPTGDEKDGIAASTPALSPTNPAVSESFADLPTTDQKTDLGQLDGAAEGTIWYSDAGGRVTRLAPGALLQVLETFAAGAPPQWADKKFSVGSQQTATGTTTVGVASPALIAGMTRTPGAGDYLVMFSSSVDMDTTNASMIVEIFVNAVGVAHTLRTFRRGGASADIQTNVVTIAFLPGVNDAEAIEIRGNVTAGLASIFQRTMIVARAET